MNKTITQTFGNKAIHKISNGNVEWRKVHALIASITDRVTGEISNIIELSFYWLRPANCTAEFHLQFISSPRKATVASKYAEISHNIANHLGDKASCCPLLVDVLTEREQLTTQTESGQIFSCSIKQMKSDLKQTMGKDNKS